MKKLLAILLVLVMVLSLCACKKGDKDQNADNNTTQSETGTTNTNTTETSSDNTEESTEGTDGTEETPETPNNNTNTNTACTHEWKAATCTAPKTCAKCKATEGKAAGHTWKDATCAAPKTCTKCNATEGGKGSHTFTADCTICGQYNADYVPLGQSSWAYTIKREGELIEASYDFFDSVADTGVNVGFTRYQTLAKYAAEMSLSVEDAREACQQTEGQLKVIDGAEYVYNGWGMDNWSSRRYKDENGVITVEFLSLDYDNNDNEVWTVKHTVVMKRTGMAELTVTSSNYEDTPVGAKLKGEYFGS